MANEVLDIFVGRLTDAYKKNPESNVSKLARVATLHIQENEEVLKQIGAWRDIDQAQGIVLDHIGQDVAQNRGVANDAVYRVLIKSKIMRNLSDGSIDTVVDFLAFILQCDRTEIHVRELWPEGKPATVNIEAPAGPVNNTGLTIKQFGTLINLVIAGGVRAEVLFEGTFEFAAAAGEASPDSGFAPLDQSSGGTLGLSYNPDTDYELPI